MAVRPYDIWTEYKGNADDGYGLIFDIPSNFGIRVHFLPTHCESARATSAYHTTYE